MNFASEQQISFISDFFRKRHIILKANWLNDAINYIISQKQSQFLVGFLYFIFFSNGFYTNI